MSLNTTSQKLNENKKQMYSVASETNYLNSIIEDTGIRATMYYYNFIVLLVVTLFLVVLLIKLSLSVNRQNGGGERNYNGYLFLLAIMVLFLLIPHFKN